MVLPRWITKMSPAVTVFSVPSSSSLRVMVPGVCACVRQEAISADSGEASMLPTFNHNSDFVILVLWWRCRGPLLDAKP